MRMVWILWFVTWLGLLAGLFDRVYYEYVVVFSAAHMLLVLWLLRFRAAAFPAQVRIGYLLWVAVGTWVPYMTLSSPSETRRPERPEIPGDTRPLRELPGRSARGN
jgi:hypothetical protein